MRTATTPGEAAAAAVSMPVTVACANGLRTKTAKVGARGPVVVDEGGATGDQLRVLHAADGIAKNRTGHGATLGPGGKGPRRRRAEER